METLLKHYWDIFEPWFVSLTPYSVEQFIQADQDTLDRWRLDYATILVKVRSLQDILPFTPIEVNGKGCQVRTTIKEVLNCEAIPRGDEPFSESSDNGPTEFSRGRVQKAEAEGTEKGKKGIGMVESSLQVEESFKEGASNSNFKKGDTVERKGVKTNSVEAQDQLVGDEAMKSVESNLEEREQLGLLNKSGPIIEMVAKMVRAQSVSLDGSNVGNQNHGSDNEEGTDQSKTYGYKLYKENDEEEVGRLGSQMIGISGTVLRQEVDSKNEKGQSTHLEEKIKGKNKREMSIPNDAGEVGRVVVVRIPECEDDTEVGDEDNDNETKLIFEMSRLMRFEFVKGEEEVLRYFASMEEDKVEGVTSM
ncbi:Uncharacterized protein TCM_025108 [Theobroma cacao]|uniref:Uncharacterized protein n=1 Tax=Theobroma cacao TaxID=3641 RepID=A0A061EZA8_THECC|nr:Uncharacterized protein TCM_025108 [Theobroma cacao]